MYARSTTVRGDPGAMDDGIAVCRNEVWSAVQGLSGCVGMIAPQALALHDNWPADLERTAELTEVPFFPQEDYQCGPAALATSMANFNVNVTPEQLINQVYLPARFRYCQVFQDRARSRSRSPRSAPWRSRRSSCQRPWALT